MFETVESQTIAASSVFLPSAGKKIDLFRNHERNHSHLVRLICASLLALYVIALLVLSPVSFPTGMRTVSHWPTLMDKPVGEDGFYMLTVADNIATKGHIVYNRGAVATGIQPLATFVFALLDLAVHALHGSSITLVRGTLLLGGVLFLFFAWQMSSLARELSAPAWGRAASTMTFLLILADFTLFRLFTYGLETGVYLVCIAACFRSTLRIARAQKTSWGEAVWLGVVAGLAGEARIDFGVLFALVLGGLLYQRWISPVRALLAGGLALLVVSPWFLFLHRVSGSWMPSSGGAESAPLTLAKLAHRSAFMATGIFGHVMPWVYGVESATTLAAGALSALALVVLLRNKVSALGSQLVAGGGPLVLVWGGSMTMLLVIYFVVFDSAHFYYRYAAPIVVCWVPLLALMLAGFRGVRMHPAKMAAALAVCFAGWAMLSLHSGRVGNSQTVAAGYVHEYYPAAHVGAFQSGVLGYFNRNVENLDGKLNGPALQALKQRRMQSFLDSEHVDVLVDWPSVIQAELPASYLQAKWRTCPAPLQGTESVCLLRRLP